MQISLRIGCVALLLVSLVERSQAEPAYRVGRAMVDITGPVVGVQMLGFVRQDQISEGIHTRQFARALAIADAAGKKRVVYVVADIAFPTHTMKLAVLERLSQSLGNAYRHENLVLTGTHTHACPGEFHHHLASSPIGGRFCRPYFDALVEGIAEAVASADADLKPCELFFAQGELDNAGANRSMPAYLNNPADERARYASDTDKTMTLVKFVRAEGPVGFLNWFAVHPTSMNYFNKLISGDNKGYASYRFEHDVKKSGFVAGFAQTNCGDVTPNLNLNNTGPGKDDTESTAIIGERQFVEAKQLFDQAGEKLEGPIDYRHTFVDFSKTVVAGEFTGQGDQPLWPSAFGYAFAAGSTEDGGGHPLFKEGMKERNALIDGIIRAAARPPEPGENFRDGHKPKVILLATGLYRPPMQEQVLPLGLVRVGSMVWVVGPCEYTTMAGRRIREAVAKELGVEPQRVIIAGYANDFAGYVTTYEEYQTQQYEGGHTLFGPWTEAAHRQEFVKLARAMAKGETVTPQAQPVDMRPFAKSTWSEGPVEKDPPEAKFGDVAVAPAQKVKADDEVSLAFWTGRPSNDYRRQDRFFTIERETAPGKWEPVIRDGDWGATCRWLQVIEKKEGDAKEKKPEAYSFALTGLKLKPDPYQMTVRWLTKDAAPGTYRVVHFGRVKREQGVERFTSTSPSFQIIAD